MFSRRRGSLPPNVVQLFLKGATMSDSRIELTTCLSLEEGEAKLLFDHANSTRQSIPDAIRDLMLAALTTPVDAGGHIDISEKFSPPAAGFVIPAETTPHGVESSHGEVSTFEFPSALPSSGDQRNADASA